MLLLNYITLDFSRPNVAVLDYAVQGDEYSRGVVAQLVGGSQAWTPPAGAGAFIEYRRPDGVSGLYDTLENGDAAVTLDGSTATLLFSAHALQVSGALAVALRFVDVTGRKLRSFEFAVNVKRELVSDDDVITDPYYNILSEQIADVLNAAASLTGMTVSNTTLPPGSAATATITGGSGGIPYNILFGIPRGDTGATGPQGPKGDPGEGSPSDALPLMDGPASAGESDLFARGDHVHPADISRAAAATHNMETYTSVTQLGLTAGSATLVGAWTALPSGALLAAPAADFSSTELPATSGCLEIVKNNGTSGSVVFLAADGSRYNKPMDGGSLGSAWLQQAAVGMARPIFGYRDITLNINIAAGTWGDIEPGSYAISGYTVVSAVVVTGSTVGIRNGAAVMIKSTGNSSGFLVYANQTLNGSITIRVNYIRNDFAGAL